jgi:hypothetical protein
MRRLAVVLLVILLLAVIVSPAKAEPKLKYDFQYLFKWTASVMGIEIDPKKPQPTLKMMPEKELLLLYEKKNGTKLLETDKDGKMIKIRLDGFYEVAKNSIYMADEINRQGETLEETIVHEIVHYFQYFYRPSIFNDLTCLKEPNPSINCPWEREARAIEKFFRLKHGLTITDEDLKEIFSQSLIK